MNHYISFEEISSQQIQQLLTLAIELKTAYKAGGNEPILAGKTLAMIFQKPSLRTRVSFELGMRHLGGHAVFLSPNEIKMGGREEIGDVAQVLSGYVDGIMARVFEHQHLIDLAKYGSVPVINGLSDYNHPAQGLTDLLTFLEYKQSFAGKKITYVGDGNNVARSLLFAGAKVGLDITIAAPDGYQLPTEDYEAAKAMCISDTQQIEFVTDPIEGVTGADAVYTDVWTSMGQEEESQQRLRVFPPYQMNANLMSCAKSDAIVMHCLPAHRGEEISAEVADGLQSVLFPQAENRLHAQKAILATLLRG